MIARTLARRLDRLEEQIVPEGEPTFLQIILVASDGTRRLGDRIELPSHNRQREPRALLLKRRLR